MPAKPAATPSRPRKSAAPRRRAAAASRPAPQPDPPPDSKFDSPGTFGAIAPDVFARNMMTVGIKAQQVLAGFAARMAETKNAGPLDPLNLMGVMLTLTRAMGENRGAVAGVRARWWQDVTQLWHSTALKMLGGEAAPPLAVPAAGDRRFRAADLQENAIFDFIKQSYLLTANAMQQTAAGLKGLDEAERRRIAFYTRQFADALAPTNFPFTNPEVLRATIATNGENLVKGLDNLLADIARGGGDVAIRRSADSFVIGENIATAPGKVVFRNDLIELLQYAPTTAKVHARPLLIFPPWINKFYILDLRPENSFIRWLVGRGYTVFVVSWVNPEGELAEKSFEDYMRGGIFAALDAVKAATGVQDPNCVGYCIGGTLLAATLAHMAAKKDARIHSATFWAAQADFSEAGELAVFVDDAQLDALKQQMDNAGGVLEGSKMASAFNMLRANDLIWSFVINNYYLGKQPAPFDLLYWNSDSTRMPRKLHLAYLRQCYHENALAKGKMVLGGVRLDLSKVTVPIYLQAAREDHIAPAASVYKSTRLFGGPVRFVMAGSGHIAGVINPPAANKYQYWTNDTLPAAFEAWRADAAEHPGSWWTDWEAWLAKRSGGMVPARKPGGGKLKVLGDAPGTYVKAR
jgi:polyhydroxyalkanoate synthase